MNHSWAQRKRKAWLVAFASGLIVLLVIGLGLLQEHAPTLALTDVEANATREEATWRAFATYAPDKATQRAIQQLTVTFLPTPTWFDAFATGEALDKMLTTSPTPGPTEPPTLFFQRPAGAGRLVIPMVQTCGYSLKCIPQDFWVEKTKDKFITVYAGHHINADGSTEAELHIEWNPVSDPDSFPTGGGTFRVPIPAQDVRIVDAIGEQLLLRTNDGTLLAFDVPSQQYISVPPPELTARMRHPVNGGLVVENNNVPFVRPGFSTLNRWSVKNAKGQLTVFGGAEGRSPENFNLGKGVLAVVTSKGEPTAADTPQIYSPTGMEPPGPRGVLWIFDVKGNLVALMDHYGSAFFFDLTTRQFISRLDEMPNRVFGAPLFDPNLPISQATPQPVTPFALGAPLSTPVLTAVPNAYP